MRLVIYETDYLLVGYLPSHIRTRAHEIIVKYSETHATENEVGQKRKGDTSRSVFKIRVQLIRVNPGHIFSHDVPFLSAFFLSQKSTTSLT